jgi:hypothetical protein
MSQKIEKTMSDVVEYLENCPLGRTEEEIVEYLTESDDDFYEIQQQVSKALNSLEDEGKVLTTGEKYRLMG